MPTVEILDLDDLRRRIGREIAVSDWLTVTQERINLFADATDDR
jgi:acyl dehydratase